MIEIIISEFVTITLALLRGVSRTPPTSKMKLCVTLVQLTSYRTPGFPEPPLLLQSLYLGPEQTLNTCFLKLMF